MRQGLQWTQQQPNACPASEFHQQGMGCILVGFGCIRGVSPNSIVNNLRRFLHVHVKGSFHDIDALLELGPRETVELAKEREILFGRQGLVEGEVLRGEADLVQLSASQAKRLQDGGANLFADTTTYTVFISLQGQYAPSRPKFDPKAALRAKLAPKGDAVLAQPGEVVELKTQTLKINARIVDLTYGSGTPANSYFQQVTLELATWSDAQ